MTDVITSNNNHDNNTFYIEEPLEIGTIKTNLISDIIFYPFELKAIVISNPKETKKFTLEDLVLKNSDGDPSIPIQLKDQLELKQLRELLQDFKIKFSITNIKNSPVLFINYDSLKEWERINRAANSQELLIKCVLEPCDEINNRKATTYKDEISIQIRPGARNNVRDPSLIINLLSKNADLINSIERQYDIKSQDNPNVDGNLSVPITLNKLAKVAEWTYRIDKKDRDQVAGQKFFQHALTRRMLIETRTYPQSDIPSPLSRELEGGGVKTSSSQRHSLPNFPLEAGEIHSRSELRTHPSNKLPELQTSPRFSPLQIAEIKQNKAVIPVLQEMGRAKEVRAQESRTSHSMSIQAPAYKSSIPLPLQGDPSPSQIEVSKESIFFFQAVKEGNLGHVIDLIQNFGVDPNADNSYQETPLFLAAQNNHIDVVKYLLKDKRVNPNAGNKYDETPLLAAVKQGNLEVVKYLVEDERVDVNAESRLGETSLSASEENGYPTIAECLYQAQLERSKKSPVLEGVNASFRQPTYRSPSSPREQKRDSQRSF